MDILGEYQRQNPIAAAPARQTFSPQAEYGFFIRLVMKLSSGRIENGRQASIVLLVAAAGILLVSLVIFLRAGGWLSSGATPTNVPIAGPQDVRFQNQQQP